MTLRIKRRNQRQWLMWLLVVLPFFFGTLMDLLGLPDIVKYTLDVAWVLLFLLRAWFHDLLDTRATRLLALWITLFLGYTLLTYIANYQSFLYYLWGMRNNFRFFAAFFAFATFLTPGDIEDFLKLFDKLFWLNFGVSLVQYFFMGYYGDQLGGLFGVVTGVNVYTNIFQVIICTKAVLFYLHKREKIRECFLKCGASLLVAVLAELKFFFVEFVLILCLSVLLTAFTWRKLGVILGGILGVLVGAALLSALFPSFAGWFSLKWLLEAASSDRGYTSDGDLNRLNALSKINELWLQDGWQRAFGLGLGNCDNAAYDFLTTPFYKENVDMHYTWLSHAYMYLECGWIGLMFYYGFFGLIFFQAGKFEKKLGGVNKIYCQLARILAICCMIITVYNATLRTEAAYMMFFILAIPYAMAREGKKYEKSKTSSGG